MQSRFASAAGRRSFFLQRMRRTHPSRGSDHALLMRLPRTRVAEEDVHESFGVPNAAVGGVATRRYMPERNTKDLDVLVSADDFAATRAHLSAAGAQRRGLRAFPDTRLGLYGECWSVAGMPPLAVLSSKQPWARDAVRQAHQDETGLRIVPLWALVALKIDASRGVDQGDLSRMLGLADADALAVVRSAMGRLMPSVREDLESLHRARPARSWTRP